ncbi:MAG: hypothetical protein KA436_02795 [Oligoflexales bacterium]|nr:hypothetical protein [Oligoflexales bacterium]
MKLPIRNKYLFLNLFFLFVTFLIYRYWLFHVDELSIRDWEYFNSLSYAIKSIVLGYKKFPVHNPWICGGLDILANPQSRVFSPNFLVDLLFYPPLSNLVSLMLYTFWGLWGTYLLLRQLELERVSSVIGSVFYINCSWFGLHFMEGHIIFGSMQILPFVTYLSLQLGKSPHYFLLLCATLSCFLLDGSIYTFTFSLYLIITLLFTNCIPFGNLKHVFLRDFFYTFSTILASILLTAPKTLPILLNLYSRQPFLEFFTMPMPLLEKAFFNIRQRIDDPTIYSMYGFHEFGCYTSPLSLILVLFITVRWRTFFINNWRYFFLALLWLSIGAGLFPSINPWFFIQKIPMLNNARLQSRVLVIFFIFLSILVAKALDRTKQDPFVFWTLAVILLSESFIARIHPTMFHPSSAGPKVHTLIQNQTITKTVPYSRAVAHYFSLNTGSANCYEPSFYPTNIQYNGSPYYQGEVYTLPKNSGSVSLRTYTPGFILIDYDLQRSAMIQLNTNTLAGWRVRSQNAKLFGRGKDLLLLEPSEKKGEIILEYEPQYFKEMTTAFLSGLIIFCLIGLRSRQRKNWGTAGSETVNIEHLLF